MEQKKDKVLRLAYLMAKAQTWQEAIDRGQELDRAIEELIAAGWQPEEG